MEEQNKSLSLWNDTFTIEVKVTENVYQGIYHNETETFTGSLKGAIRHLFKKKYKGNVTAVFLNSNGDFIKEIGW